MNFKSIKHADKQRLYKVYCIHPKGDYDINKYYIGVTKNSLKFRLTQHSTSKRPVGTHIRDLGIDNVAITLVQQLPLEDALKLEYSLRPTMHIGWNSMAGGCVATSKCVVCNKPMPHKGRGYTCISCKDTRFKAGAKPHNFGTGVKCVLVSPDGIEYQPESLT